MPQWEGSEVRGEKRKSHLAKGTAKSMILEVGIRTGESTNLISLYCTLSSIRFVFVVRTIVTYQIAHTHFAVVELYLVIFGRISATFRLS